MRLSKGDCPYSRWVGVQCTVFSELGKKIYRNFMSVALLGTSNDKRPTTQIALIAEKVDCECLEKFSLQCEKGECALLFFAKVA